MAILILSSLLLAFLSFAIRDLRIANDWSIMDIESNLCEPLHVETARYRHIT